MSKIIKNAALYTIGSFGYGVTEILFRGYTHWSMCVTGGICFLMLYRIQLKFSDFAMWKRCLLGAMSITAAELWVGCIVNLYLGWNVWDYSQRMFNLAGQICPLFSFLWFLISFPVMAAIEKANALFLKTKSKRMLT